jgi:polysaccharide export outer membrane protein
MKKIRTTGKLICPSFIVTKNIRLSFVLTLLLLVGCSYKNRPILLKPPSKIKTNGVPIYRYNSSYDSTALPYQHRIQPDNRIKIIQLNSEISESTTALSLADGFLVDPNGNIRLPIVGEVFVQGLTRQEAARLLEKVFSIYFKNPMFQIEIINLFALVIGESGSNTGGDFVTLDKERTHLIEVLGKAGGVPNFAKIKYIKIIRGDYRNPQIIIVDISQLAVIKEDDLIMQNGDLIYLEPKGIKIASESVAPYIGFFAFLNLFGTILLIVNVLSSSSGNNNP